MSQETGKPQVTSEEREHVGSRRDPEERNVSGAQEAQEKSLDKTLADSFPTSDPPSTIPDPAAHSSEELKRRQIEEELADLPVGTWAALTIEDHLLVGTGNTRGEAVESARKKGYSILNLVKVRAKSPLGLAS